MDLNNIVFNDTKIQKNAQFKHVFVNYNDDHVKNASLKVCGVKVPFGVKYNEYGNNVNATITISLDETQKEMLEFIHKFEDMVIKEAITKSEDWFGKKYSKQDIKNMFRQSIYDKNPMYPPTLGIKVPPNTTVCDNNKTVIKLSSIDKGKFVDVEFIIGGIWISQNKFGVTWKTRFIQTSKSKHKTQKQPMEKMNTYAFDDE